MLSITNCYINEINTTMRYHLTLVRMAIIKSLQTTSAGEDVGKRDPSYMLVGMKTGTAHYGQQYGDLGVSVALRCSTEALHQGNRGQGKSGGIGHRCCHVQEMEHEELHL